MFKNDLKLKKNLNSYNQGPNQLFHFYGVRSIKSNFEYPSMENFWGAGGL